MILESYSNPVFRMGESLIWNQPIQMSIPPSTPSAVDTYVAPSSSESVLRGMQQEVYNFDAETLQGFGQINQRLVQSGKSPIDPVQLTQKIEAIANDPRLSDKEKRAAINDLRKQSGLTKGEMKKFFTKRLERICARAVDALRSSGSVDANLLQNLEQKQKLYSSMYKPGGCVKKMFKGVAKPFVSLAKETFQKVKTVLNPKNWLKPAFWRDVVIPAAIQFIPGVGTAASFAQGMIAKAAPKILSGMAKAKNYLDLAANL